MHTKFKIIKSEFINNSFPLDTKYIHWSRLYEWKYVIDTVNNLKPKSIHNTACGGLNTGDCLHLTFCSDLDNLCENATHSDLWGGGYIGTETKPEKDNFIFYDITQPLDKKFDLVLNISTIEHLPNDKRLLAIENLMNQVKKDGHLILTFDYPDVNISEIEEFFKIKINRENQIITNGALSVILIHLIKL